MNSTKIKIMLVVLMATMFTMHSIAKSNESYESLRNAFNNPTNTARPKVYWWCLNGNIDTLRARQEFLEIKKRGLAGFDFFEIGAIPSSATKAGPAYFSDESVQYIKFAALEAKKLGLDMGLNVSSSWNAGGSWIPAKYAAKKLYKSEITIKSTTKTQTITVPFPEVNISHETLVGGTKKQLLKYLPNGRPEYYEEIAVLAFPTNTPKNTMDTAQIIDITKYFNSETNELKWNAPPGDWTVQRFISSNSGQEIVLPSPNSAGLSIDHFEAEAVKFHLNYMLDKLKSALGDFSKTGLKTMYFASYEAKGGLWTPQLPSEFKKQNGYEITKFLPYFFSNELFSDATNKRMKIDVNKTVSELMINNLFKTAREICNPLGLKVNCEAGGPGYPLYNGSAEPLKVLGSLDIPRGEFWVNYPLPYIDDKTGQKTDLLRVVKEVAAASHIYEKGIVEQESFTSFQQWQEGPCDMRPYADRAYCEGMNRQCIHGFSHTPSGQKSPGITYHAGTHFNNQNIWWSKATPFVSYLSRLNSVFQNSKFYADVLYYYGDKIPNAGAPKNTHFKVGAGYDYEIVNTDILLNRLTYSDGKFKLSNGAEFCMLALNYEDVMNPEVLAKLYEFAKQGAKIVGSKPQLVGKLVNNPNDDAQIQQINSSIWSDEKDAGVIAKSNKPVIYTAVSPLEMVRILNVQPDFNYADKDSMAIDYIHYQKDNNDVFFVRNNKLKPESRTLEFRLTGKVPEMWNTITGEIYPIPVYNQTNAYTQIPMSFPAYGSYLIVFRDTAESPAISTITNKNGEPVLIDYTANGAMIAKNGKYEITKNGKTKTVEVNNKVQRVDGSWNVSFAKGYDAPQSIEFPTLSSWTENANQAIKYFSGFATYSKSFDNKLSATKGNRIYLDLGEVSKIADVTLNGKPLGITWTKPFRYDITDVVKNGKNELKVEVANTWSNRIVGDALNGTKYTETNIAATVLPVKSIEIAEKRPEIPWKEVPLIESGLLGPVTVETIKLIK
ncbi:MAG: glycosyl hydrolase [Paludibacter sp.]